MARPQWSTTLYAPSTVTATPAAAVNFPASRLITYVPCPLTRRFRSTSQAAQQIDIDLGSSGPVQGIALLGANFQGYSFSYSTDNVSFTSLAASSLPSIGQDPFDGYNKTFFSANFTARYLRLNIAATATPLDNFNYWTLGAIVAVSALATWPRDLPVPRTIELMRASLNSGNDAFPAGSFFIAEEIQTFLAASEISPLQTIGLLGEHLPFLWYRNLGNSSHVYLMRLSGGLKYTFRGASYEASPQFVELV